MSDKPVVYDATAWTGHLPTDWPRAIDHPEPQPVEARESLKKSIFVTSFLLLIGVAPWLPFSKGDFNKAAIVYLLAGLWMTWRSVRVYRQRRHVLTLDERGLTWPGGYQRTIPWSEITQAHHNRVFFPMPWFPGVFIRVRDGLRYGPTVLGKPVTTGVEGLEGIRPLPWLLDVKPRVIISTIEAYRAYLGRAQNVDG